MSTLKPPVSSGDHIRGDLNSTVVLAEYGDFDCPHCAIAHTIIKKLEMKYKGQMAFVFRHFPLSKVHPNARTAAIAAEAAAKQGKFWEMHDMILENQSKLSPSYLLRMAKSLGLDMNAFEKDSQDQKIFDKIDSDFESGIRSGVNGTPSLYINGMKYNDAYDHESMEAAIGNAISNPAVPK